MSKKPNKQEMIFLNTLLHRFGNVTISNGGPSRGEWPDYCDQVEGLENKDLVESFAGFWSTLVRVKDPVLDCSTAIELYMKGRYDDYSL